MSNSCRNSLIKSNTTFCNKCEGVMDVATITNTTELRRVRELNSTWTMGESVFRCRDCKHVRGFEDILRVLVLVRNYADMSSMHVHDEDADIAVNKQLYNNDPSLPSIKATCPVCLSQYATYVKTAPRELTYQYTCRRGHSWTNNDNGN